MAEAFGITCHDLVNLDFRSGSTTDSEGCPQFRPLLGVEQTSISGSWMSVPSQNRTLAPQQNMPADGLCCCSKSFDCL